MEMTNDMTGQPAPAPSDDVAKEAPQNVKALVQKLIKTIKADKEHHKKAFDRMRRDMFVAMHGREEDWNESSYKANIAGRHVKQKTAALYAKNPRAVARRRDRLDFEVWDEDPNSLKIAMQTVMMAAQAAGEAHTAPPSVDPATGQPIPAPQPAMPPGFEQAQAIVEDFQRGTQLRQMVSKLGKTLEILYSNSVREQKPLDFKTSLKQTVRRTCTTGVGYAEIGFQRQFGPRPGMEEKLADARARLAHLQRLSEEVQEGEIEPDDAEMAELEAAVAALQAEPEIVVREGLIFDFPASTKVIPDKLCKKLVGFIGARHLTVEYDFTTDEVEELFQVDLKDGYTPYSPDGTPLKGNEMTANQVPDDEESSTSDTTPARGMVRVWKHYDKPSGLVYFVADGYCEMLREPGPPDVFVEDFWPLYALTFNDVESEKELFPSSDVTLIIDMQREYNRSRQGMREHRNAARPRWVTTRGALEGDDIELLKGMKPFDVISLNKEPGTKISELLETIPVPGVDPNLYETHQLFEDMQLVVGAQEAQLGATSQSTATESAIAAGASHSSDGSSIDDLDAFLTCLARSSGQILLKEMSEEQVKRIVGPGAMWPHLSLADIADEIFLEVEAGSTGKPNQAIEMQNWQTMLPFLIQMPGISPMFLARESLRRLDDKMDLTDAFDPQMPSIIAQNSMQQPAPGDPGMDPNQQGGKGAQNAPAPPGGPSGTGPAFGSNQV